MNSTANIVINEVTYNFDLQKIDFYISIAGLEIDTPFTFDLSEEDRETLETQLLLMWLENSKNITVSNG